MHILTVIGARPQFVKAAVLSRYIRNNSALGIKETLLHTGQHYDQNMSDIFFTEMEIPQPDINLNIGSGSHGKTTGLMIGEIEKEIINKKPDIVLVYGDTNSTFAGALAASKIHIPVAHVEAGLRSFMMVMPEEQNRRLTDHLSTWLFCPTQTAIDNLTHEGIINSGDIIKPDNDNKKVIRTGDIMYDASLYYRQKCEIDIKEKDFILLTIHRAENTDNPTKLAEIVKAINDLVDYKFIFPVHPRTRKILERENLYFGKHVNMIDPVGYLKMIAYETSCYAVLTDSGGVQKEAFFYKKPCVTMRDSTEWVELVNAGWNVLTGSDYTKIVTTVKNIKIPPNYPDLYGDGKCAEEILCSLKKE
jgi:UDP-GlcNAc3NAcA epimerase